MKFAMCNEFCEGWTIDDAFRLARDTGYDGELVVELIPPGRVVSYGDIAELTGSSPRRVGTIMAARMANPHSAAWPGVLPRGAPRKTMAEASTTSKSS